MNSYADFLSKKKLTIEWDGLPCQTISPSLFDFQAAIVKHALENGRLAIWADCGLGKTAMALEWARQVVHQTNGRVLILTPLAVAQQFVAERFKLNLDLDIGVARDSSGIRRVTVTNYERLHNFNPSDFMGIVLDESSILKSYDGKTRNMLIQVFNATPYKLAMTATPAPNDHVELGNHSEFLGALSRAEMLGTFFVNDSGRSNAWRLKGHAIQDFWEWISNWAVALQTPADLGFDGSAFKLPRLKLLEHVVESRHTSEGRLFPVEAVTLTEQRDSRRKSISDRADVVAQLCNHTAEPWVIWCDLNAESEALAQAIPDGVEVRGSDSIDQKETVLNAFTRGEIRVLIIKPTIAGFGVNWQHCARTAFVGPTHSFEQWYQAIRRLYRFGQTRDVECHMVLTTADHAVLRNLKRKQRDAERMVKGMLDVAGEMFKRKLGEKQCQSGAYSPKQTMTLPSWLTIP